VRALILALAAAAVLVATRARAHGPQIQITIDGSKLVTRELLFDGPYSAALTPPKSVYVMPLLPVDGVWYSRPNCEIDSITTLPAFPSGPGIAYGADLADGGPQAFAAGSVLTIRFADRLMRWNGAAFVDADATQLKAFRGSNVNVTSPLENFAITSDTGPFDSLSLPAVAANYGAEGAEVHNSLRFALLGDGASPASPSPDGIYLLKLQLSSTQAGLSASDIYNFVLYKNASLDQVAAAVQSLGLGSAAVQWVTPEPHTAALAALALTVLWSALNRSIRQRTSRNAQPRTPNPKR
jgi:hypothetical protein